MIQGSYAGSEKVLHSQSLKDSGLPSKNTGENL